MNVSVTVRPEAQEEWKEAYLWYESKESGLGDRFTNDVLECVERIQEHPKAFPVALGLARKAKLRIFPYSIFYEWAEHALVLHVIFHDSRDPEVWKKRLNRIE